MPNNKHSKERLKNKFDKRIEKEIAIAVGVANMIGCMTGKCTDSVIEARNKAIKNIQKLFKTDD